MNNDTEPRKGEEHERRYTLSINDDERQRSFDLEDERWESSKQIRDWVIVIIITLAYLAIQLSVYFLEPGLK